MCNIYVCYSIKLLFVTPLSVHYAIKCLLCHKKMLCYAIKRLNNVYASVMEDGLVHYHRSCHSYEEFEPEISHSCAIGLTAGSAKPDGLIIVVLFASTGVGVVDTVTVSVFIDTCGCFSVVVAPVSSDLTSSSNLPSKPWLIHHCRSRHESLYRGTPFAQRRSFAHSTKVLLLVFPVSTSSRY